jgi:hypothetical protein
VADGESSQGWAKSTGGESAISLRDVFVSILECYHLLVHLIASEDGDLGHIRLWEWVRSPGADLRTKLCLRTRRNGQLA